MVANLTFKLRVNSNNQIEYSFYKKPMASNRCLQAETALNQNCLVRSLSNEVIRRLDSFSPGMPILDRVAVLDKYSQKLANSGHKTTSIRNIMVNGIRGYQRRVARCKAQGMPLHRSAHQSSGARRKKKLLAGTNWFRDAKKDEQQRWRASEADERLPGQDHPSTRIQSQSDREGRDCLGIYAVQQGPVEWCTMWEKQVQTMPTVRR